MAQALSPSDVAAWKALTEQLPGVLSVEYVVEGASVREVHVLSDQSRSPKQIVRDIQSALLARFQVELDHRVVSVAQIPGLPQTVQRRLVCDRLEFSTGRAGASASVTLVLGEHQRTGISRSDLSTAGRDRTIAQAAVDSINQFLDPSCRFCLEELKTTAIGSQAAVLAALRLEYGGKSESLLGACFLGEDPNFSVALAVLDGVNRRILTLPFSLSEEESA